MKYILYIKTYNDLGEKLNASVDLNSLYDNKVHLWMISSGSVAKGCSNKPSFDNTVGEIGILFVPFSNSTNYGIQYIYERYGLSTAPTTRLWERTKFQNTWSSWFSKYDDYLLTSKFGYTNTPQINSTNEGWYRIISNAKIDTVTGFITIGRNWYSYQPNCCTLAVSFNTYNADAQILSSSIEDMSDCDQVREIRFTKNNNTANVDIKINGSQLTSGGNSYFISSYLRSNKLNLSNFTDILLPTPTIVPETPTGETIYYTKSILPYHHNVSNLYTFYTNNTVKSFIIHNQAIVYGFKNNNGNIFSIHAVINRDGAINYLNKQIPSVWTQYFVAETEVFSGYCKLTIGFNSNTMITWTIIYS